MRDLIAVIMLILNILLAVAYGVFSIGIEYNLISETELGFLRDGLLTATQIVAIIVIMFGVDWLSRRTQNRHKK